MPNNVDARMIENLRRHITRQVAAGFESADQIAHAAAEMFCDDADLSVLRLLAQRLTHELVAAHLTAQADWPDVTDCDRLDDAMAELTRSGIVCRQSFACCGPCGVAEIGAEMMAERRAGIAVRGYAFYHMQDTEGAVDGAGLFLNYGAVRTGSVFITEIGREIVDALRKHGLQAHWNGQASTRVAVSLDWKRRFRPRSSV